MVSGLWFGLYTVAGPIFGGLAAQTAMRKGLLPGRWFFPGLVLTPGAWEYPLMCSCVDSGRHSRHTHAPLACPKCGGLNHPPAGSCPSLPVILTPPPAVRTEIPIIRALMKLLQALLDSPNMATRRPVVDARFQSKIQDPK